LKLEPSVLSKIINAKRQLTLKTFDRIAQSLRLSPEQIEKYAPKDKIIRRRQRKTPKIKISKYRYVTAQQFASISDWHCFALLELIQTRDFKGTPAWIAKALDIERKKAETAISRLMKLGFIEILPNGKWVDRSGSITVSRSGSTGASHRKLQKQILTQSMKALKTLDLSKRDHSSLTMAINSSLLPEAKKRIKRFRRELCEFLKSDSGSRDQVFQLAISLFPIL
jgi:uncharacterized protein (TIGR02147 family)